MSESHSIARDTPRRTPMQFRPYLNIPHGMHQSPHNNSNNSRSPHMILQTNSMVEEENQLIYGTNISTNQTIRNLQRFVLEFDVNTQVGNEMMTQKYYYNQLNDLDLNDEETIFEVSGLHLKEFDREMYHQFIYFPAEMISCFDYVIKTLYEKYFIESQNDPGKKSDKEMKKDKLMIGIKHLADDQILTLKELNPTSINKLLCFQGIAIRASEIFPEMKSAFFRCTNPSCKQEVQVTLDNAKVQEPTECSRCHAKNSLEIIHNLCRFTDKQFIKFQQLPQKVPQGQTPSSITIIAYDSNVDAIRPGDRVQIVGIYRAQPNRAQKSKNIIKSVFSTYLDVISFNILEKDTFKACSGSNEAQFSDDEKFKFLQMADDENIINRLIQSFAPSIYGHQQIKKGILAQLFSGTKKNLAMTGRGQCRSDINICLVGDPSTAKSQMLQQVYKIAPRGVYTSGRGSSAVGLTANVRKDPQTNEFVLQSGALILSDLGICCIDEFDKMDQNSRTILLEAMEQQTISIAKAGIVCQLNSRTSILAAANPLHSKYDPKKSVIQNINLTPALLSRFDLIYIMLDIPNETQDKRLALHLLDMYSNKEKKSINKGYYDKALLAKYITYARERVSPQITESAGKRLAQAYVSMREIGNSKKIITATVRQLQSLIRVSEAFAKMRLSPTVQDKDVEQAINLIRIATQQAATDPTTGLIDMDIIATGRSAASKEKMDKIVRAIMEICNANIVKYKKTSSIEAFKPEVQKLLNSAEGELTMNDLMSAMRMLQTEDYLTVFGQNKNSMNFRYSKAVDDR